MQPAGQESQTTWSVRAWLRFISAAALCALLILASGGRLPETSGAVELLFPPASSSLSWLTTEQDIFEHVYTDIIVVRVDNSSAVSFDTDTLAEELLTVDGIQSVLSPSTLSAEEPFGLIAAETGYARIILKIDSSLPHSERLRVTEHINSILREYRQLAPQRTGTFITMQAVADAVASETERTIPWIIAVLAASILLIFKDIRIFLLICGNTAVTLASVLAGYAALGYPLGPISQLAPPFLLAISVSFNIHVIVRMLQISPLQREKLLRELQKGILLAALTTSASLLSLLFLQVEDVSRFAGLAAAGTILAAGYSLILSWPVIRGHPSLPRTPRATISLFATQPYRRLILAATLTGGILCTSGIARLEVHTDPLRFLPADSAVLEQIRAANKAFPGNHYLSIIATRHDGHWQEDQLSFLETLRTTLLALSDVEQVITPLEFTRSIENPAATSFIQGFSLRDTTIPHTFFSSNRKSFRILIETSLEGKDLLALASSIEDILGNQIELQADATYGVTSLERVMAEQTDRIVRGLVQSLLTTVAFVFVLLLITLRNFWIALIGLIPNVVPLLAVFGFLGFISNELDFGSCLVAASALGIAVDNTFHFLFCWNELRHTTTAEVSLQETVSRTARPFLITSLTLVAAFSVMVLARSEPVMHFGILLAVTLLVGLFADLILLPILLRSVPDRWRAPDLVHSQ